MERKQRPKRSRKGQTMDENGLIAYRLAIEVQCPHCKSIDDISLSPFQPEDARVVDYVERELVIQLVKKYLKQDLFIPSKEEVIEFTCDNCGREAEYKPGIIEYSAQRSSPEEEEN